MSGVSLFPMHNVGIYRTYWAIEKKSYNGREWRKKLEGEKSTHQETVSSLQTWVVYRSYTSMYIYISVSTYIPISIPISKYTYTSMYTGRYIHIHTYIYVHIHIHIHIHIHTPPEIRKFSKVHLCRDFHELREFVTCVLYVAVWCSVLQVLPRLMWCSVLHCVATAPRTCVLQCVAVPLIVCVLQCVEV